MKRRIFLQGLAGATLAAPMLSTFVAKKASAQTADPKRLVIFLTHNGCVTDKWFPMVETGTIDAAALAGTTLEPLTPFANKLLFPRGLRSLNEYGQTQTIDPHDQAMGAKLTCSTIDSANKRYATSISLDHVVAQAINPGAGKTSMVLSVGASSTSVKEICSYTGPLMPFQANVNPQTIFSELTSAFKDPGAAPANPMTPLDYHLAMGGSVVDTVRDDLMRLQAMNVSMSDKRKIETWISLLEETGQGIVQLGGGGGAQCTEGGLGITPDAVSAAGTGGGTGDALAKSFTLGGDMMLKLIALSMVCDTNRSFVMTYPGYVKFNWDGMNHTSEHHGLSHRNGSTIEVGGTCQAHVMEDLADIDNWFAKKYTSLVETLAGVPEGDVSVLDNSAVTWIQELSDGNAHNQNNLPIVIAGSLGGYLKQGYSGNVETGKTAGRGTSSKNCTNGNTDNSSFFTGSSGSQVPINKLYVTLMNGLGMRQANGEKFTEFGVYDTEKATGIKNPGELDLLIQSGV